MERYTDKLKIITYNVLEKKSNGKHFIDINKNRYYLIKIKVENNMGNRYYIHQIRYESIEWLRNNKLKKGSEYIFDLKVFKNPKNYRAETVKYIDNIRY